MKKIKKAMCAVISAANLLALSTPVISTCAAEYPAASSSITQETESFYNVWKKNYLLENPYSSDEKQYYVWHSGQKYSDNNKEVPVSVSEATGYGMLISACMADYDEDAHEIYDGLYNFYKAHTSEAGPNLMAWQQSDNGKGLIDTSGANSASDADLDIAYSLLIADSVWGSEGQINYKQSAINVINDIMEYEVNKTDWLIQLGDWVSLSEPDDEYFNMIRTSDFMVQYMPVFAEVTGDDRWMQVYESTYDIINKFLEKYGTGTLPDFIVKDDSTGEYVPSPPNLLEGENDGNYSYNACRDPWRICMDYLINGNTDALNYADTINKFIKNSTKNIPSKIAAGYTPYGIQTVSYSDLAFTAPFLIAAACEEDSEWHDAVRQYVLNYPANFYYGDSIKMLCLISDDGGWIVPGSSEDVYGDVNSDGVFDLSDIIALQKWLVKSDSSIDEDKADVNQDNTINIYDSCQLKRSILNSDM
ncbi:MAG: glycosyl hydrolase family 8 [Porcipelethomonas sp.]